MICTIYSKTTGFEFIQETIKKHIPKGKVSLLNQDDFRVLEVQSGGGIFSSKSKLKIAYRERLAPNTPLHSSENCDLSKNINGLYGFVNSFPSKNEKVKELFKMKIQTLNCEFSFIQEAGETKNLKNIILDLSNKFDAILFAQPNTIISKAEGQHFLNRNLKLILDRTGNSEIDSLGPEIEEQYLKREQQYRENVLDKLTSDQRARKLNNEQSLKQLGTKVNKFLPAVESEAEVKIRTPKEIAGRLTAMAFINGFASNFLTVEQIENALKKNELWELLTPKELDLLNNPTAEKKQTETWKYEGIWVLLWALNITPDLGDPSNLCDLGNIPREKYPLIDPKGFINSITESRSKKEILDAADLYYRLDWACVDARVNNIQLKNPNSSVVYERHYALNWLINYLDQEWDEVSCDT